MAEFRIMAIAAASGRIGYVVMAEDKLVDWGISRAASRSSKKAHAKAKDWIDQLKPEVVVTEAIGPPSRKHGKTLVIMEAITNAAKDSDVINVTTSKTRSHRDKYQEAKILAKRYPELQTRLAKKPACWLAEPRRMILFEALSLALRIRQTE
ncbi:MAG: hypothetical protein QM488_12560 [Rhizobiaceae bacterium]